jgi:hypothetical protein
MYRDSQRRGTLDSLPWQVRDCCEFLKKQNGGRLPAPKGGAPSNLHRRLLIEMRIKTSIEREGGVRGSVTRALKDAAKHFRIEYRLAREIHYDSDPEWRRLVKVEWAWRHLVPTVSGGNHEIKRDIQRLNPFSAYRQRPGCRKLPELHCFRRAVDGD